MATGSYNTFFFRLNALAAVGLLQAWLMWNFITFHLRRQRENAAATQAALALSTSAGSSKSKKTQQEKAKARKEQKQPKREAAAAAAAAAAADEANDSELPEVDQNTKKTLRQRK